MKNKQRNWRVRALVFAASLPIIGPAVIRGMNRVSHVLNRFDAVYQGWGERSWLFQDLKDAFLEFDAMTRQEAQRIHEGLIENSPIVQKIRNLKIQFSVGPSGLKLIPESSDEGYNDARSESWENWWSAPELGCDISGAMLTRVWAGLLFDKGGIFVNLTSEKIKGADIPRLQTIDCHRVKNPSGMVKDGPTGFPIIDGVVINPDSGKRIAYYVRRNNFVNAIVSGTQTTEENFDRIPAYDASQPRKGGIVHKFKVRRPGQIRELPEGLCVYNLVRDNMDLHKLEMQAAKLASSIGPVETNPSGELDALANRKARLNINTTNAAAQPIIKQTWSDYTVGVGAQKIALKTGSKIEDFMVRRPTVATQEYWDLHITFICVGYNVPKMLVMPYSLQGTVTRADLDICRSAFLEDFELIRELCETVYAWQTEWELKDNPKFTGSRWQQNSQAAFERHKNNLHAFETLQHCQDSSWVMDSKNPDDAHVCLIRPPRAPNVDIGYTAKALEIELRLGVKCMQDVYADGGKDWRQQTRQIAEYIAYVQALEKEFKLQPGQITSLTVPAAIQDPTTRPDPPEGDSKESSPESKHHAEIH